VAVVAAEEGESGTEEPVDVGRDFVASWLIEALHPVMFLIL
jgi:hypothetical protein